uniref:hypothetical protein n=1 Tax=Pseudomonas sp. BF-B-15 TaxID=2832367 RepID=UPI001CC02A8C
IFRRYRRQAGSYNWICVRSDWVGNANQLCAELNIVSDTKPVGAGLLAMAAERFALDFPTLSPASWLLQLTLRQVRLGR